MGKTGESKRGEWVKQEREKVKEKKKLFFVVFYSHKLNIWNHRKQHGGCEAQWMNPASDQRVNGVLPQMLGGRTPQANGQEHIAQSGKYCYSSLRLATTDEV